LLAKKLVLTRTLTVKNKSIGTTMTRKSIVNVARYTLKPLCSDGASSFFFFRESTINKKEKSK